MNLIIIRTLLLFTATVVFLRLMGKREIGQLQPYELVIIIMISELAAIPMQNTSIPIINGLIPIFILFAAHVTLSFLALKSEIARDVICGKPSIIIDNSRIMEDEMRKLRYNINDLLEQLREKNVLNIADVEFAVLETNGDLSVFLKSDKRPLQPSDLGISPVYEGLPVTLVTDGKVNHQNLQKINQDIKWLEDQFKNAGTTYKRVLYANYDSQGKLYFQNKQ
ncbi:MAG TPA: DUF421 domain-containing protein [Syntrophomonadaceae bacterium]|nr:DUF421 domain-containing protein [Syntrophomonadaceae bacterium]HNX28529.1 DUF421 domain-containing protein [Syntrophomonadaceae bacterium]HPR93037.1 DUF421 domain-containing protein [Syntrophomonadaceae bacterium]